MQCHYIYFPDGNPDFDSECRRDAICSGCHKEHADHNARLAIGALNSALRPHHGDGIMCSAKDVRSIAARNRLMEVCS